MTEDYEVIATRSMYLRKSRNFPTPEFERTLLLVSRAPNLVNGKFTGLEFPLTRTVDSGILFDFIDHPYESLDDAQANAINAARIVTQINWGGVNPLDFDGLR